MLSLISKRRGSPHTLAVAMSGVQMGDRLVYVGCSDPQRLAAIAAKVGLSGRAAAVVPTNSDEAHVAKAASRAGVLVETEVAPLHRLPFGDAEFDIAVVDNINGQLAAMEPSSRAAIVSDVLRVLRPAGRVMVISKGKPHGIRALFGKSDAGAAFDVATLLKENGFGTARLLADKEGLTFVEALRPRQ